MSAGLQPFVYAGDHVLVSMSTFPVGEHLVSAPPTYCAAEGHLVSISAFPQCWRTSSSPCISSLSSLLRCLTA